EGAVSVRGPLSPGGIELRAGQTLRIADGEIRISDADAGPSPDVHLRTPSPAERVEESEGHASSPKASATGAPPPSVVTAAPRRAMAWPARVASGDFSGVLADARARGVEASLQQVSLADLVALADAARYAGQPEIARRALVAERVRFPASAEARAAAF